MSAHYLQRLVAIAAQAQQAGHGNKEPIYQQAMQDLGVSRAKLLADLKQVTVGVNRKRRSDAGKVLLEREEAVVLGAVLSEGYRKNRKKITAVTTGIAMLRTSGLISATKLDKETGEMIKLSDSAIARGLRAHGLHPEQLQQATPHTPLRSEHPNYCWQVDTSVCVLYYLPDNSTALMELDKAVHYKNRPDKLGAIERFRVIRYVVADHRTGFLAYRYYPHSESGENTVRFLAWAMAEKDNGNPFHGRPMQIMVDGGATAGGLVRRFCQVMGIELIVNQAYNPRAKGAVEKGNHLIETSFEQALRFHSPRPANFDQLNALADEYQFWWNGTAIHSRTKKTRLAAWMTITDQQLIKTPNAAVLLSLATEKPATPKVNGDLTVQFKTRTWDVSHLPNVMINEKITVHWHPFSENAAMALVIDENGQEVHIALPEKIKDDFGQFLDAPVIGKEYKSHADTLIDKNRKEVQRLSTGADSLAEVSKKQADKHRIPLAGQADPFKASREAEPPIYLPQRGTEIELAVPQHQELKNNAIKIAVFLKERLGDSYSIAVVQEVTQRYPEGATNSELEAALVNLINGKTATGKPRLAAV